MCGNTSHFHGQKPVPEMLSNGLRHRPQAFNSSSSSSSLSLKTASLHLTEAVTCVSRGESVFLVLVVIEAGKETLITGDEASNLTTQLWLSI